MKTMTTREAYDWISSDCTAALAAGTTIEEWEALDEEARLKIAEEYAEWINSIPCH